MKKTIERICKNCKLFDAKSRVCAVIILHEGKRRNLPTDAEDKCFFEQGYFDPTTRAIEDFAGEIQEVKFWVEDENGEKTRGDGKVMIQYPENFFPDSPKF